MSRAFLIGGATGVGKSTFARELAVRENIVHITGTDTIREVLRDVLNPIFVPDLYYKSFEARDFESQLRVVATGINAVLRRAAIEQFDVIIEGIHVVPGYYSVPTLVEPWQVVLHAPNNSEHLKRLEHREGRGDYTGSMPSITILQNFVEAKALEHGVPVLTSDEAWVLARAHTLGESHD